MPVNEQQLSAVVTRPRANSVRLYERDPVAGLIVESLAASAPEHERSIRDAGTFLLDLLRVNEPDGTRLTLPVAIRVLTRDEGRPMGDVCTHLAQVARRDLLLGIAVQALAGGAARHGSERRHHREAVTRALYLLIRMFEVQEEVDALHRKYDGT